MIGGLPSFVCGEPGATWRVHVLSQHSRQRGLGEQEPTTQEQAPHYSVQHDRYAQGLGDDAVAGEGPLSGAVQYLT